MEIIKKKTFIPLLFSSILILSNSCINNQPSNELGNSNDSQDKVSQVETSVSKNKNKESNSIVCNGEVYDLFPSSEQIDNKEFSDLLNKLPKIETKNGYTRVMNQPFKSNIKSYIFNDTANHFDSNGILINYQTRLDGESIEWTPVGILPTNGKFIMMLCVYWELGAYEPPSKGYFLSTFSLKGDLLSMVYAYGHEEFKSSAHNKEIISSIWGKAYCLNTNKVIVRKAVNWDSYINRDGYIGTEIEVSELTYSISDTGKIEIEDTKIIFPRKHVKCKDRSDKSFEQESDTIKSLLGII